MSFTVRLLKQNGDIMIERSSSQTDGGKEANRASHQEKFKLLYDSLLDLYNNFLTSAFSVSGFLLLVIGWLITSETAQCTLKEHSGLKYIGIIALLFAVVLYIFSLTESGTIRGRLSWSLRNLIICHYTSMKREESQA